MRNRNIKRIAAGGVFAAIIILLTTLVSVPMPGGHGFINLGDAGVLTAAYLLGGALGASCAGLASALSDVLLGWSIYAPATFLIKGACALLAYYLLKHVRVGHYYLAFIPAALIVPLGYFAYESLLYGLAAAVPNVILNLVQCVTGALVAQALALLIERTGILKQLKIETIHGKSGGTEHGNEQK